MKDNKKIDVKDLYYATIKYDDNNIDYGIFKIDKKVVNINTNAKYSIRYMDSDNILLEDDIKITGIFPFTKLFDYIGGKCYVEYILKMDKYISKKYDKEKDRYIFNNPTEMQRTLAIIKPDGIEHITKIIEMIYKSELTIERYEVRMLNEKILSEHYSHLLDKPFYPKLKDYMLSGEVVLMILKGKNAVEKLRELMGPTDSTKAPCGTIRGEFGTDITYNAIHGSDSKESAKIEIDRFFNKKVINIPRSLDCCIFDTENKPKQKRI